MTTHEIINLGFQQANSIAVNEYVNGLVKVQTEDNNVTSVFVTNIKVNSIKSIDELQYLCKRLNITA
jgi:pyruvate/2-oxoglutarate dehydrogenase complex dihydrolipoamide acyltransferase (E2) component